MRSEPPVLPDNQLSVRRYAGTYEAHAHAHAQILLGLAGRLDLEIGGQGVFVDPSCGVLIPAGVDHGFMARGQVRVLVIDAQPQLRLQRMRRFAITAPVLALAGRPDAADRLVGVAADAPLIQSRRGLDLAQLDAALAATLHQPWTTARMAALFALSTQRFHARLLELTGVPPQQYLRQQRLERAVHALRGGLTLEACALRVGYRSASALAYALRRDRQTSTRRLRDGPGR